jgi:large-conductance mechanosensitive channel
MIQVAAAFLILAFIIFFITFVKISNRVIHKLEEKEKTTYTENEL